MSAKTPRLTFTKDIAPIIFKHCTSCHHQGSVAPFPLASYEDVKKSAALIVAVTQSRDMPPWKPEPHYGSFVDANRLTDSEIDTIRTWVQEGSVEGISADLPPTPHYTHKWHLGKPDVILKMSVPYQVPPKGGDIYRCFVIPTHLLEDKYYVAFEELPDNPKVVHHSIVVQAPDGAAQRLEKVPGKGYPCYGGFGIPTSGFVGIWTLGAVPRRDPAGVADVLRKGSDLVVQVHFRPAGKPEKEQIAVGFYFSKSPPEKIAEYISVDSYDIDIPPGDDNYKLKAFTFVPQNVEVLAVYPHAHYLARVLRAKAILPNGIVKPLLLINDWDFNYQQQYWYVSPVKLPQGTRLDLEIMYDNSAKNPRNPNHPPKRVIWGFQATDEMAYLQLKVITEGNGSQLQMATPWDALIQEYRQLIETKPDDAKLYYDLATLLQRKGDLHQAFAALNKALELDPHMPEAHYDLGLILWQQGHLDYGIKEFRDAIRVRPTYEQAYFKLGAALFQKEELDSALTEFQAALRLNPQNAGAYLAVGSILERKGNIDAAAAAFHHAQMLMNARMTQDHHF